MMSRFGWGCVVALLFVACWEWASQLMQMPFALPPPSLVAIGLWEHSDRFWLHSGATLREMLGGLGIAILIAFPLSAMMVTWRKTDQWLASLLITLQCIPMAALAPLMVIWFGWTYTAVLIPIVLMLSFPLILTFYAGLNAVPDSYIALFRGWGAAERLLLLRLRLPWALPQMAYGLRIAAGMAGMGAVVAEWAGAQQGLGVLMLESRRAADIVTLFGAIVCLTVLTLVLTHALACFQRLAAAQRPLKVLWGSYYYRGQLASCAGIAALLAVISLHTLPIETQENDRELRLVLDWFPNPNHIPLYVGIEQGIFRKHQLPLQISKLQDPGDTLPYLTSRQADIAVMYMPSLVLGQAASAGLRVMGYLVKEPLVALIKRKGLAFSQPCVVGCATDGIQTPLLRALLDQHALAGSRMISVSFDLVAALLSGQVDAIFGGYWNIETEHIRALGMEVDYVTLPELGVPHHFELLLMGLNNRANPEMIDRFRSALQESIDWCRAYPDAAFACYTRCNPDKTAASLAWEQLAWQRTVPTLAKNQNDEPEVWQRYAEWLKQRGLL